MMASLLVSFSLCNGRVSGLKTRAGRFVFLAYNLQHIRRCSAVAEHYFVVKITKGSVCVCVLSLPTERSQNNKQNDVCMCIVSAYVCSALILFNVSSFSHLKPKTRNISEHRQLFWWREVITHMVRSDQKTLMYLAAFYRRGNFKICTGKILLTSNTNVWSNGLLVSRKVQNYHTYPF